MKVKRLLADFLKSYLSQAGRRGMEMGRDYIGVGDDWAFSIYNRIDHRLMESLFINR